jgi:predicted acylesterase/phospholipase RssA
MEKNNFNGVRRALVLSGGGALGAYEVGVMKALVSMGVEFDIVFGASVGALNGVFYAQHDLDRLEELWCTWRPRGVTRPALLPVVQMLCAGQIGVVDTRVLEKMLREELDLSALHASSTTAGFAITDLCTFDTEIVTTDNIFTMNSLLDVLMASCAVPFIFPPRKLNGKGLWIDGGIIRNAPVLAALMMGMTEIYVVLLHANERRTCPTNPRQYFSRCMDMIFTASALTGVEFITQYNALRDGTGEGEHVGLKILQPQSPPQMGFIDFDPDKLKQLMRQGYDDTLFLLSGNDAEQSFGERRKSA